MGGVSRETMKAIVIARPGGPEVLELRDVPTPTPAAREVRVRVRACAVNRADLLQRIGAYPAPPDAPSAEIPGLEIAGEVDALGPGVTELEVGQAVYGVVSGGAYAEAIVVPARTLARIPAGLEFTNAAAVPEAFVTAYDAAVVQGGLAAGETLLVHAVGSGVGTAAVQIARAVGARVVGTARHESKLERARVLGLDHGIVPEPGPSFADRVRAVTGGGADVALDLVGGAYVPETMLALAERGRAVLVGLMAGSRGELDFGVILRRRLSLRGTVLRARPLEEKILAAQLLARNLSPLFASGELRPVVDRVLPLERAGEAHEYLASNDSYGKVVLTVG